MKVSYNGLWKILIDKNMNKKELAQACKLSPATVSKIKPQIKRTILRSQIVTGSRKKMEVFMTEDKNLVIVDNREIQNMIYAIRGKQVMVDSDLATLYQVTTKRLNEQVRRNKNRFPSEFMFRLTAEEYEYLRSHFATSSEDNAHGDGSIS